MLRWTLTVRASLEVQRYCMFYLKLYNQIDVKIKQGNAVNGSKFNVFQY